MNKDRANDAVQTEGNYSTTPVIENGADNEETVWSNSCTTFEEVSVKLRPKSQRNKSDQGISLQQAKRSFGTEPD